MFVVHQRDLGSLSGEEVYCWEIIEASEEDLEKTTTGEDEPPKGRLVCTCDDVSDAHKIRMLLQRDEERSRASR